MKIRYYFLLLLLLSLSVFAAQNNRGAVNEVKYELPKADSRSQIVQHTGYTLSYSEANEQASWVAYVLTKEHVETRGIKRTNKFIEDPLVKTGSATNADYAHSGYDRGHLAPAADMGWSEATMRESFFFSNMSPQEPSFNRGVWKELEEQVRAWAIDNGRLYIATGPVLRAGLAKIGSDGVAVPRYYYKVILDYTEPGLKAIGFIMPNQGSDLPVRHFAVSVDSVEHFTGINFFYQLPDDVEKRLEAKVDPNLWSWKRKKSH
ncbi:DNA/RNA non-specific endonuclease [uncultured Acetobacteroides sp.]|uniref:DNA/RNA non-specific endonuclease n=1 Tax=uncultured Acetobacteroides sp. TaxID=1760811 RepID=UPI0029F540C5|nr:DNA/RNA non-specific endonuclease [uncultured Acetobacteroides sp.]